MYQSLHPLALFRIAVLGELLTRDALAQGELKKLCQAAAATSHRLPNGDVKRFSAKTIERWYYAWRHGGVDALAPKTRLDKGQSQLTPNIQQMIIEFKQDKPSRSVNTIKLLLEQSHQVAVNTLSRSAIYRVLKAKGLSSRSLTTSERIERRGFVAKHASDIWHADVLHGPRITLNGQSRKLYLVSMLDDASRAIMHSEFRLNEQAVDIECVFKQAILKRGLPKKLIIDNGAAYRAHTLQSIAARLEVQLVYCPAYEPQGKGKLERWHRTFREQFLSEWVLSAITSLGDANSHLWAWIDVVYHQAPHSQLAKGQTPLTRWQQDLAKVRQLGALAQHIDSIFYHREKRRVKKDGCVQFNGKAYEVPYELAEQTVHIIIDAEEDVVLGVEDKQGNGYSVTRLDKLANVHRQRQRPKTTQPTPSQHSLTHDVLKNQKNKQSLLNH